MCRTCSGLLPPAKSGLAQFLPPHSPLSDRPASLPVWDRQKNTLPTPTPTPGSESSAIRGEPAPSIPRRSTARPFLSDNFPNSGRPPQPNSPNSHQCPAPITRPTTRVVPDRILYCRGNWVYSRSLLRCGDRPVSRRSPPTSTDSLAPARPTSGCQKQALLLDDPGRLLVGEMSFWQSK